MEVHIRFCNYLRGHFAKYPKRKRGSQVRKNTSHARQRVHVKRKNPRIEKHNRR